jgi:hypothetical protein
MSFEVEVSVIFQHSLDRLRRGTSAVRMRRGGPCMNESNSSTIKGNRFSGLTSRSARLLKSKRIARAIPETVTAQPRGSVLLLVDFTGASFNNEALLAMKESAVFDKPYIKKSAWVGATNLPTAFEQNLRDFSRREFPSFKSREEALTWLVED